jgi:signal peptidase
VVVKGTSMQPTLYEGDLALLRKHSEYQPGDIVAYRVPEGDEGEGAVIIHRIVSGDAESGYTLLGDNRDSEDRWHPRASDVVGSSWFHVAGLGDWFAKLFEPTGRILLVGGVTLFLLIGNGSDNGDRKPMLRRRVPMGSGLVVTTPAKAR